MAFWDGLKVGFAMIILIGPVFFTIVQGTLKNGFWAGWMVAWGIIISDAVVVILCAYGAAPLIKNPDNQFWLGIAGACILFFLGFKYLFKPSLNTEGKNLSKTKGLIGHFIKGFLVNGVNPFVFVVWIGVIGVGQGKWGMEQDSMIFQFSWDLIWYLLGALVAIFITDSLTVVFAHQIKKFIKPEILTWVFRIAGIALICFGLYWVLYVTLPPGTLPFSKS